VLNLRSAMPNFVHFNIRQTTFLFRVWRFARFGFVHLFHSLEVSLKLNINDDLHKC
jgi:hypothetical protein